MNDDSVSEVEEVKPEEEKKELGLKETNEVLKALELVATAVVKVLEDGQVTLADIQHLAALARDIDVLMAGINNADEAIDELKDLDQAEIMQLVVGVFSIVKKIGKAKIIKGL